MNRGEVWLVDFEPSVGGEIQKTRPAVIVSNDAANRALNRVQVIPISSKIETVYPAEALVTVKGQPRKAMADQLATVSKLRLKRRVGVLSPKDMQRVEGAIRLQLDLPGSPGETL